jgi:hypothetical protein
MPTDKNTQASAEDILKQKLASLDGKYIAVTKVANLKGEVASELKAYWRELYGEDYADAMVAKK